MKTTTQSEMRRNQVGTCASLHRIGFPWIASVAGLLVFSFPFRILSQSIPYGLSVMSRLGVRMMEQGTTLLDDDEVIKPATQTLSYTYDVPLSATGVYGTCFSGLRAAINPGILRFSWLGKSAVASGLGVTNANSYSEASIFLNMGWEDTITISCPSLPANAEAILRVSHSLHGTISNSPPKTYNGGLSIIAWVNLFANNDQQTSEFQTNESDESIDFYRVIFLKTRVGETVRLLMDLQAAGGVSTELYDGKITPENSSSTKTINAGSYDSNRLGISATNPDIILTSASGYKYPSHAMSPTQVTDHLAKMKIKRVDFGPTPGTVSFVIDAIPGARYVLQRSTNLVNWKVIGSPANPTDFGELVLTDNPTPEPSQFWRIAATEQP